MELPWLIRIFSTLCFSITATLSVSLSMPGCQEKCGNITIPFTFGIGSKCSSTPFAVVCNNLTNPPKLFLSSLGLEVENISLYGTVTVKQPVLPMNCSDGPRRESVGKSFKGSRFTISAHYNSMLVIGCRNSVWLRTNETTVGGCTPFCDTNSTDTSCNGVNCCRIKFPRRVQEIEFTYESIQASNSSSCGYVFIADTEWVQNEVYKRHNGLLSDRMNPFDPKFRFAPLVLEWDYAGITNEFNSYCKTSNDFRTSMSDHLFDNDYCLVNQVHDYGTQEYPDVYCQRCPLDYRCQPLLANLDQAFRLSFYYSAFDYVSSSRYCACSPGYEGNPYIVGGCSDFDECLNPESCGNQNCTNTTGSFACYGNGAYYVDENDRFRGIIKISSIVIGSVVGALILLMATWKFSKAIVKLIELIKASRKYMFFKRNGGLLLEQQLVVIETGIERIRLFTSIELGKATDDYNENRILGRGGEGVVYKGMLEDGKIVAVKKLETVNQGDVESFINEVVIVSQINHRNVVKLLGCCLESEVPRLVYEFIPNGTLFDHIHDPNEDFPLFWEMRVRIAKEIAGALAYLHSAASVPIYHRDIKSTNILLDEKYHAKISDFGTSRSVLIDQTHVTTRVVGTFGYLDPEYFQSSQFTEKSDVYSFGVVLVELLTGEKAISAARVEEGRGLAMHFLHSMEENQLFDIVDGRVLKEGKREAIESMAGIAKRCLHLNGKGRPTMKEVARDLEAIQVEKEETNFLPNQNGFNGGSASEDDDSDNSFTILEINSPDTQQHSS